MPIACALRVSILQLSFWNEYLMCAMNYDKWHSLLFDVNRAPARFSAAILKLTFHKWSRRHRDIASIFEFHSCFGNKWKLAGKYSWMIYFDIIVEQCVMLFNNISFIITRAQAVSPPYEYWIVLYTSLSPWYKKVESAIVFVWALKGVWCHWFYYLYVICFPALVWRVAPRWLLCLVLYYSITPRGPQNVICTPIT